MLIQNETRALTFYNQVWYNCSSDNVPSYLQGYDLTYCIGFSLIEIFRKKFGRRIQKKKYTKFKFKE